MDIPTIRPRFLRELMMSFMSLVPKPRVAPKIGPISGETSMAPMITGIELTFSPTEAMTMANARM